MVMIPTSSNRSLRSFSRTSRVSMPSRSRRSRLSRNNAPRGTAMRNSLTGGPSGPLLGAAAFLAGEGDMHALDVQREANGRQRAPEGAQQLVVAAATAQRDAVGGVIDLKQRAGVVPQAPHQAQVEDDAVGHLWGQEAVDLAHAAQRVVQRALQPLQHLGSAAGV